MKNLLWFSFPLSLAISGPPNQWCTKSGLCRLLWALWIQFFLLGSPAWHFLPPKSGRGLTQERDPWGVAEEHCISPCRSINGRIPMKFSSCSNLHKHGCFCEPLGLQVQLSPITLTLTAWTKPQCLNPPQFMGALNSPASTTSSGFQ